MIDRDGLTDLHAAAVAAQDALGVLVERLEARIGALETRFTALETRTAGIERGIDEIARSNHRIEQMLAEILAR